MTTFSGVDFMEFDSLLSDDEKDIRQKARDFTSERILPIIADYFARDEMPVHLIKEMGEAGLFGATLSGYGCQGVSETAYGLMMQELERGDSSVRSFASVQSALVMYPIYTFGSDEQKEKWLPRLAAGDILGCFGLTEPDYGSNPAGMEMSARRDGNSYILNGTKKWITNGGEADLALIWAKNETGDVEAFLIERGTPGFSTPLQTRKFSMRAASTSMLVCENCRIPAENKLPFTQGIKSALMCLTKARYGIAWGVIGAAMACYREALEYCQKRIQFDKPIASFQMIQEKLVEMVTEITKMQFMTLQLGRLMDQGQAKHYHVSMCKRNNVYQALQIARATRDLLGANGIVLDYQVGRHLCNLETVITYEGTHNIHTLILGQHVTGIAAFV